MFRVRFAEAVVPLFAGAAFVAPTGAQVPVDPPIASESAAPAPPYAFTADLVLGAPVIADATIRSVARLKGADAAGAAPGMVRVYVEADVTALVRGPDGAPPRVGYLFDLTPGPDGRLPRLRKARVLLFARSTDTTGQLQLVAPEGQQPWSPALDALTRRIARDALAADAPPRVTGITSAFHVAGSLPGEGETQIFLSTADHRPVSLSILRRPGEDPRWAVALSEIVDDAAAPPARDTLLWYRLACALPRRLPEPSTQTLEGADAEQARADYQFVLDQLGPCGPRPSLIRDASSAGAAPG